MLLAALRKLFLTFITLVILSIISYNILLRDPLNNLFESDFSTYIDYVTNLLQGDWGISQTTGEPLVKQILDVFPATISLCIAVLILSLIVGVPLGFLSATLYKNPVGKILSTVASLSLALPVFWFAILMLSYASLNQWEISAIGEIHPIYYVEAITGVTFIDILLAESPYKLKMMQSALQHLALPTIVLAVPATLEMIRIIEQRTLYILQQNYIKIAQARGWSSFKIWKNHILRNTLLPLLPTIIRNITLTFAFAMLIENVISWGGIGRWMINALMIQDYHAISVGVITIGIFVLLVDLLASIVATLLDPSQKKDWYVK
ncbi:ABC transporter permease [Otariodibacter oris]|uniref:Cationic peptide transport system permease protein n=1 Tax=Otariodibacter oris TaxID=1032623 RepID=A0A420XIY7_9PAST|nr:ABC transporter permease subunit [Otariodibacter oris]QGM81683.1 peptide ABC transporter permease [Otariodibacter oris]RKR77050.1 cationic peptide transport system permease protein [Otariodibacter oris]